MSPRSNLAEHLVQSLNVVCGRFVREGEAITNPGAAGPRQSFPAQAYSPQRTFEGAPAGSVGDYTMLFGERMSCILADDILSDDLGRVRAMIVSGANPVATLPDQRKVVRAFESLDLLVAIEPYMTTTAKLCDYILSPRLMYERADLPMVALERALYPLPFTQFTPALASPPHGSDVVEDWYVFWALAKRMGLKLAMGGEQLPSDKPPSAEELIELLLRSSIVPFEEIVRHPGGAIFDVPPQTAAPADPATKGRLEVAPPDIVCDLLEVASENGVQSDEAADFPHLLIVRRVRETINTLGPHLAAIKRRMKFNAVQLHGSDIEAHGLHDGQPVFLVSRHGRIPAIVERDDTLRPGVVSMAHGWGGLPEEGLAFEDAGASPTLLISTDSDLEPVNAMARLSAIPVRFEPRDIAAA
jgi:anaerobic selenocysteine-containing dehydrogenase